MGWSKATRIAAPNIVPYFTLIGAVQLVGATVALMSPTVERNEFAGIYDRVHPAVAIVSTEAHCRLAAECAPYTHVMTVTCLVDGVPSVERAWKGSAAWDGLAFDDDPKFILFTSGSTGTPKAVQLRGSSFCRHAGELTRALQVQAGEVFFIPVPFAHVYGVVALHTALSHHATVATLVKYRPEQAMSLITSVHANVYLGVSTMYLRELRENQNGEWDLSCLRAGLVAGATSPLAVFEEYEKRYGATLVNSYGMTETAAPFAATRVTDNVIGTVGQPAPGSSIRISDEGELQVKGPNVFRGYHNLPEKTAEAFTADGWLRTGDLAEIDDEGHIVITGRIKDIIITAGGKNVSPIPLEEEIAKCPIVEHCVVVGDQRPFIGALVTLDPESLALWLPAHGLSTETPVDRLATNAAVREEIQQYVDKANATVSRAESVRKFAVLDTQFTQENKCLTPSLKVVRPAVNRVFADVIDNEIYNGKR